MMMTSDGSAVSISSSESICVTVEGQDRSLGTPLLLKNSNDPKPKPRWDVHLRYIGDRAVILAEILRPLIAGWCGSDA